MLLYPILLVSVKAMLLCAIAAGALALARGISSATRHAIWTAAVAGLLLFPVAYFLLPSWQPPLSASLAGWRSSAIPLWVHVQQGSINANTNQTRTSPPTTRSEALRPGSPPNSAPLLEARTAVLFLWGLGTSLVLLWLGVGYAVLGNISRAAEDMTDPLWRGILTDTKDEVGVRRDVRLRTSSDISAPCLAGALHPVILLPRDAADWTSEKRRSVLLHELAHVRRHDRSTQFLAQFVCALLWFSPLHWYAARRIRIERERACDDRVLASGVSPAVYADILLDVAKTFRFKRGVASAAVAMARYANLEERLLAVLSDKANRRTITSVHAKMAVLFMIVLAVSLGTLRADETDKGELMSKSFSASPTRKTSSRPGVAGQSVATAATKSAGVRPDPSQAKFHRTSVLDSIYARVLPNDGATELVLTGREIRYVFTVDGIKSMEQQARAHARAELPAFASEGISNMRMVFPLGDVHDVTFNLHSLTLHMQQSVVRHDGRSNRGVFAIDSVSSSDAREFIRQFDMLKSRR